MWQNTFYVVGTEANEDDWYVHDEEKRGALILILLRTRVSLSALPGKYVYVTYKKIAVARIYCIFGGVCPVVFLVPFPSPRSCRQLL